MARPGSLKSKQRTSNRIVAKQNCGVTSVITNRKVNVAVGIRDFSHLHPSHSIKRNFLRNIEIIARVFTLQIALFVVLLLDVYFRHSLAQRSEEECIVAISFCASGWMKRKSTKRETTYASIIRRALFNFLYWKNSTFVINFIVKVEAHVHKVLNSILNPKK
jgi:hypothetical protein